MLGAIVTIAATSVAGVLAARTVSRDASPRQPSAVRVRADAVGALERAAQRERRAVADLAGDRGDAWLRSARSRSAASASRQPVRKAIGGSPT